MDLFWTWQNKKELYSIVDYLMFLIEIMDPYSFCIFYQSFLTNNTSYYTTLFCSYYKASY